MLDQSHVQELGYTPHMVPIMLFTIYTVHNACSGWSGTHDTPVGAACGTHPGLTMVGITCGVHPGPARTGAACCCTVLDQEEWATVI